MIYMLIIVPSTNRSMFNPQRKEKSIMSLKRLSTHIACIATNKLIPMGSFIVLNYV